MRMPPASSSTVSGFSADLCILLKASASRRQTVRRPRMHLPEHPIAAAANDSSYGIRMTDSVRMLRRRGESDRARMVLSGRMADVCAALEHLSRAEAMSGKR